LLVFGALVLSFVRCGGFVPILVLKKKEALVLFEIIM